ncbi:MAG: DUF3604 domain-containing protein [Pseudomonadota bacterium]
MDPSRDGEPPRRAFMVLMALFAGTDGNAQDDDPCILDAPGREAFFGDVHVHTRLSFDSYIFDNALGPDDAYRAARGEIVFLSPAVPDEPPREFQLQGPPLDFAAVTDHSDLLGETNLCTAPGSEQDTFISDAIGQDFIDLGLIEQGTRLIENCAAFRATRERMDSIFLAALCTSEPTDRQLCSVTNAYLSSAWRETVEAADDAYAPCIFTTFAGYEYTGNNAESGRIARNHRNAIFRDTAPLISEAGEINLLPVSRDDVFLASRFREILREECIGIEGDPEHPGLPDCDVLAIPHTTNASLGTAFQLADDESESARIAMEPLIEVVQHKQSSECSPDSHPQDPGCDFEPYVPAPDEWAIAATQGMIRSGLSRGMRDAFLAGGENPFTYGFIAGTDTHNSTPGAVAENNFLGHVGLLDSTRTKRLSSSNVTFNPGGLAGVWAQSNTREDIFDALRQRETFATSGPRISLRTAANWRSGPPLEENPRSLCRQLQRDELANVTPMGSHLPALPEPTARPQLLIVAGADPNSANLADVHIVRARLNSAGNIEENTIVLPSPADGVRQICRAWMDQEFDPQRPAYYYVRVLQEPTARYSKRQCNVVADQWNCENPEDLEGPYAACCDDDYFRDIQERAWASPIYFDPSVTAAVSHLP